MPGRDFLERLFDLGGMSFLARGTEVRLRLRVI
jgi:hypothetical protein